STIYVAGPVSPARPKTVFRPKLETDAGSAYSREAMAYKGVDLGSLRNDIDSYLTQYGQVLTTAFNTYAQRFEAYCFLEEFKRLKAAGLAPVLRNPGGAKYVVLKFYTRGRPSKYSHCEFSVRGEHIEMHHNLKIRSFHAGSPGAVDPEPGFHLDLAFI